MPAEAAHWVMCRMLKYIMNPGRPDWTQDDQDQAHAQFRADLDFVDTVPDEPPPLPAASDFPPDEGAERWLNENLDVQMKGDLKRAFEDGEDEIQRANEEAPDDPNEVKWLLAFGPKSDEPRITLLLDPATATTPIPRWVLVYFADLLAGRGPGRPPKTLGQRLEHNNNWLAERDVPRLLKLLRTLYPKAPMRAPGNRSSISKLAVQLAADRWRVHPATLKHFRERGPNDRRRLKSKPAQNPKG